MMFEYIYTEAGHEFPFYYTITDGLIFIFHPCIIEYLSYKLTVWKHHTFTSEAFEEELNDITKEIRAFGSHTIDGD